MHELGGHPVVLRADELQLSRGEALRDTALCYRARCARSACARADVVAARACADTPVPVINMLTACTTPARRWPTC